MDFELILAVVIVAVSFALILKWQLETTYGKIAPSKAVTDAYNAFRIDPDQYYYISGSEDCPNAIIGISKAWTLQTDLWKRIELDSQGMKDLVQTMQDKMLERGIALHGFVIVDSGGRKIGDWYSVLSSNPTVRLKGQSRLALDTPPQDTYQR
jgi:hypothetical protein